MSKEERDHLLQKMGSDITEVNLLAERGEWSLARTYLNRFFAAAGMLAMDIDENDPVEREN